MSMGYKGKFYIDTAGSTATTLVTNVQDFDYDLQLTKGATDERGDGSAPPIEYEQVGGRKPVLTWKMREKDDAILTLLRAAAATGGAVAARCKNSSTGTGFDGDITVTCKNGQPYKDTMTYEFTGTPTNELRDALLNA